MAGSPPPGHGYPQQPQGNYPPPGNYPPQQSGYPPQGGQPAYDPSAPYGVDPRTGIPYSDKQKMVAGLLQILLGGFGVGRFYTGHTGIAVAQLCLTLFVCGTGAIWALIDGIMILTGDNATDANGRPLRPN
jgi:TM2 domain-containing membrane protein YozV